MPKRIIKFFFNFLVVCLVLSHKIFSFEEAMDIKSRDEIVNLLQKWPQDFNAKNIQATCGIFASDIISSYAGTTDKNFEQTCRFIEAAFANQNKIFSYEVPHIEEIIIQGDIAVVRLIWNLKIYHKNQMKTEWLKEKGLDVFKRQKDGSWKIAISYAYPETH